MKNICDHCGSALYQREDDREESITVRLQAYERSTSPLIEFYRRLGLLVPIPSNGSPDEILAQTLAKLEEPSPVAHSLNPLLEGAG